MEQNQNNQAEMSPEKRLQNAQVRGMLESQQGQINELSAKLANQSGDMAVLSEQLKMAREEITRLSAELAKYQETKTVAAPAAAPDEPQQEA